MSYNIDQIKIILDTNIPGKAPVPLTSKMLYNPKLKTTANLEEYPFITFDQRYPAFLYRMSYSEKVEFFFNKDKFIDIMRRYTNFGKKPQETKVENVVNDTNLSAETKKQIESKINNAIKRADTLRASIPQAIENEKDKKRGDQEFKGWEKKYKEVIEEIGRYLDADANGYKVQINEENTKILKDKLRQFLDGKKTDFMNRGFDVSKFPYDKISSTNRTGQANSGARQYNTNIKDNILKDLQNEAETAKIEELMGPEEENIKKRINENADQIIKDVQAGIQSEMPKSSTNAISTSGISQRDVDFNAVVNENIMMMLTLLFPTSYPIPGNINSSYKLIILDDQGFHFSLNDLVPGALKPYVFSTQAMYSYLKIDGKTYTITQVLWLNDLYNHRDYAELVIKYDKLTRWKERELLRLDNEIEKRRTNFKKDFSTTMQNGMQHPGSWMITQDDINKLIEAKGKLPADAYGTNKYAEIGRNVDELVTNLGKFNAYVGMQFPEYTALSDLAVAIEKLYQKVKDSIQIPQKLGRNFAELTRQIDAMRVSEIIRDKYIRNKGLILNLDNEEPKVREELQSKFKEYIGFGTVIKDFVRPKKESTNKSMQIQFDSFLDNTSKFLIEKMMQPQIMIEVRDRAEKETLNTGVTVLGEGTPKYEIQVMVDVIGGEINDETRSKVNCIYQGESLGNDLDRLLGFAPNKWEIDRKNRFFFDISAPEVKNAIASATATEPVKSEQQQNQEQKKPANLEQQQQPTNPNPISGGRTLYKKKNARTMRTYLLQSKIMRQTRKLFF